MGQAGGTARRSPTDIQSYLDKEKEKFLEKYENPMRQNGKLEDFTMIRTIGTGSFGNENEFNEKNSSRKMFISF